MQRSLADVLFAGGLTVRLDLIKKNFWLSLFAASIGVMIPIALCYALLYVGFGYGMFMSPRKSASQRSVH